MSLQDETRLAMQTAPGYWLAWYSMKSMLLVGVAAGLAYYVGREHGRRGRRS